MKLIKNLFNKFVNRETISYIIFGVLTTAVNWIATFILQKIFKSGIEAEDTAFLGLTFNAAVLLCNAIAWVVAVAFAFVTNRKYVFESQSRGLAEVFKEFCKFVGSRLVTGAIEIVLPSVLMGIGLGMTLFGIKGAIAKAITSVAVIILNYIFSKLFVFKKDK